VCGCSDNGIVRTLDVPVYATECNGTTLHCLDREGKTLSILIDPSGACMPDVAACGSSTAACV
jgi:hypothetical protein